MIGADELTVLDKNCNVVFTAREPKAKERINAYLEEAKKAGFDVKGDQIMERKGVIHAAMAGV